MTLSWASARAKMAGSITFAIQNLRTLETKQLITDANEIK